MGTKIGTVVELDCHHSGWLAFLLIGILGACSPSAFESPHKEMGEELIGGETTVFDESRNAFGISARNLSFEERTTFLIGNSFFELNWIAGKASTEARDGLGPLFNARSCSSCHMFDGRGRPPENKDEPLVGLLFRISRPGKGANGGVVIDPHYGDQLQTNGLPNVAAEGNVEIQYEEVPGQFADGTPYSLRRPKYSFVELAYGPMSEDIRVSPRVAPAMIGLGLLEAIPEQALLNHVDPDDKDGDGISGRPNRVWDVLRKKRVIGRFGWKANQPTLRQQNAGAFLGDIGITTSMFPDENCGSDQEDCKNQLNGGSPEAEDSLLDQLTFYTQTLAVPARRDWQMESVRKGKSLFIAAGCETCHVSHYVTSTDEQVPAPLRNQIIRPFTDLLLHDMGRELADHREDFEANGQEWRTPPLWGLGLQKTVNGHTYLLHDGRARNITEAILWHGGEAELARERFRKMPEQEREFLLDFLNSL